MCSIHNYFWLASGVSKGVQAQLLYILAFTQFIKCPSVEEFWQPQSHALFISFISFNPLFWLKKRKHYTVARIDWLSSCWLMALLILHRNYIFSCLLLRKIDAVMKEGKVINVLQCFCMGQIHWWSNIDSHPERFSGSPDIVLGYIINLQ